VKFLSPALVTAVGTERFTREGNILARLTHPAIAHLIDAGVTPTGQPYLVLEYVDGVAIDRHVDERDLGLDARLVLVRQVLDAVAHAHANLVVHRDLKPSNILVRPDGRVALLDFGIAKLVQRDDAPGAAATQLTADGSAMTPEYAAPEQISGGAITTRTDVYALGVVLYRLLSGRHPHEEATRSPIDLFKAIAGTDPPPMSRVARTPFAHALAGDLETMVAKALCKPPEARYDSVRALAEDLARYARGEPVSARPASAAYRTRKWLGRNRALAAVAASAILATFTGLGVAVWQAREASRERDVAQRERDRALRARDNSEAATEFFNFLLTDAGPVDAPITVDALMKRSDALLNGQFSTNTEHQASILNVQASYYLSTLNLVEGRARATRATAIAREAGDIELLASALCLQGAAEVQAGARAEGTRLIDEALGLQGLSARNRVSCHLQRSYIARNSDDGATALRHAQAALDIVGQDGRISKRTEAIIYSDLGYAEQLLGRIGDADRSFAKAMEIMTAIGQEHSTAAGTMLNNWGIAAQAAGDTLRARALLERALEAAKQRDREAAPPIALVVNFARLQLQTGRFDEARRLYSEAVALARHQGSGLSEAYALNGLGMVAAERNELDAAERYLAQTRALTSAMPSGTPAIANADLLEGQIALARGRIEVAAAMFTRLREVYDAQPPNAAAAGIRIFLAEVALESGRPNEAAALAEDAVARHRALQGGLPYSRGVGLSLYALARARQAQGRRAEALLAATEGAEHLEHAIGTVHPSFARLVELQTSLRAGS
jgi:eukaryotic-like serine/threonine-protein kinase